MLENKLSKPQKLEASYLTSGINWKADYVAVLNKLDTMTDLTGWVTIDNQSGATYQNALLKLVAGDIHRVQGEMRMDYARPMAAAKEASPQFKEESFFEYHLYTLDRRTTIKDNQTKADDPSRCQSGSHQETLYLLRIASILLLSNEPGHK